MPYGAKARPVHIKPLTGPMDTRSSPDEVPFGGHRWIENWQVDSKYKLCRMPGWKRLQDGDGFNNQDLRDQNISGGNPDPETYSSREPCQFLYEAVSPAGFAKLFAGYQSRLYSKNSATGNWKVLVDGLMTPVAGCNDNVRWSAGVSNETVVFSNNVNEPFYTVIDQPVVEGTTNSVRAIPDLQLLNVTKVGLVIVYKDLVLLLNVTQDGIRRSDRIIWSDYQRPLSYLPDPGISLAGQKDLGSGETILGVAPINDRLFIYTTRGIWECSAVGGELVLAFGKRYSPIKVGSRCLAFSNTLVSTGAGHYYFGNDGIYYYDYYTVEPKLVDWIHMASATIFDSIDKTKCNVHCGGYQSDRRQVWWSWVDEGFLCPAMALVINVEFPFSSYVDHGFTAFVNHAPDTLSLFRGFLIDNCICTAEELLTYGDDFERSGGYCAAQTAPDCDDPPVDLYSSSSIEIDGITVEDYLGDPDEDSIIGRLGSLTFEDLCADEWNSDSCNADLLFIMASASDYCLKEYADVYYREECTVFGECPDDSTYIKNGYASLLRSGPMDLKLPDDDKILSRFAIEILPAEQTIPSKIRLRIGIAAQALDPNLPNSATQVILWEQQDDKDLVGLSGGTEAEHRARMTRPNEEMEWGLFYTTRFVYYELEIINPSVTPENTGGRCCISRVTFDAEPFLRDVH